MEAHLFGLKRTAFILWSRKTQAAPKLAVGQFKSGNLPSLVNRWEFGSSRWPGITLINH